MAYRTDRLGKVVGAAVFKIIPINRGDHDVVQAKLLHRISHASRFENV
jgi:hypothetical protein